MQDKHDIKFYFEQLIGHVDAEEHLILLKLYEEQVDFMRDSQMQPSKAQFGTAAAAYRKFEEGKQR